MRRRITSTQKPDTWRRRTRCYSLVRTLIECGKLIPICYEEGNMLARVDIDGEYTETSRAALTEFDKCYIKKNVD